MGCSQGRPAASPNTQPRLPTHQIEVVKKLDGETIEADLRDAKDVRDVRYRIAKALGHPPGSSLRLCSGDEIVSDTDELSGVGTSLVAILDQREPSWLPMNKYLYQGKEVLKISSAKACGPSGKVQLQSSTVHFLGGEEEESNKFDEYDALVKQLGFSVYRNDETAGGGIVMSGFDAVPTEDPTEWKEFNVPGAPQDDGARGWRVVLPPRS